VCGEVKQIETERKDRKRRGRENGSKEAREIEWGGMGMMEVEIKRESGVRKRVYTLPYTYKQHTHVQ